MSKSKRPRHPQPVAKAFPPSPKPIKSALPTDENEPQRPPPDMPVMGVDPIRAYDKLKTDFYCARQAEWDIYHSNEDALTIESAIVGQLVNSEIRVVSTKPEGQRNRFDRDEERDIEKFFDRALGRSGGRTSFIKGMVKGVSASKTGATVPIVWDRNGTPVEFGLIDPISTRPYYKDGNETVWDWDGHRTNVRTIRPAGIFFRGPAGFWQAMPEGSYYQAVYNSRGRGAWVTGDSLATENLPSLAFGSILSQFIRHVILGIDASQILLANNVDIDGENGVMSQVKRRKEARRRPDQNLDDVGNTLLFSQLNPDILADLKILYLRGLPEGVPFLEVVDMYAMKLSNGFGVKKSRVGTLTAMLRYAGSGAQAAMQEGDEWGFGVHKEALLSFYNFLIGNRPFRATIVGSDDPKSYARVAHFNLAGQAVSQLKGIFPEETLQQFMVDLGATTRDSLGPVPATQAQPAPVAKASTTDEDKLEENVLTCATMLQEKWLFFVENELPVLFEDNAITDDELETSLSDIAAKIYAQVAACIESAASGLNDRYIRNLKLTALRGINNLIGPVSRWTPTMRPQRPAWTIIREYETRILMRLASFEDLQLALRNLGRYVDDYANLSKSANWYALGAASDGPVDWVRTAQESCVDCINYEGTYGSFQELLARTSGRLPGNPSLADRGHCKCYLVFR